MTENEYKLILNKYKFIVDKEEVHDIVSFEFSTNFSLPKTIRTISTTVLCNTDLKQDPNKYLNKKLKVTRNDVYIFIGTIKALYIEFTEKGIEYTHIETKDNRKKE